MKEANEYRLGNVFLRMFYVSLDYDKDMILLGVNKGAELTAAAGVYGKSNNPYKERE
jgi:hypothetical protein